MKPSVANLTPGPLYYQDQDWFVNAAAKVNTSYSAPECLRITQDIERSLGKKKEIKNGPRNIDIDLLLYENQIIRESNIMVPHPRLHERLFVLKPLMDVAPQLRHPILGKTIEELASLIIES